jgi:hypothetical protein
LPEGSAAIQAMVYAGCRTMSKVGKQIISGLESFLQKLQNNEPIEMIEVQKVETPDGPMHIRKKVVMDCHSENEKN